ncbi:adenylate/guanylate cyclase domain-containing protein [Rubellicoccus peritrichatus]|uniref:Adenylate/guanylate cyclase domain-containing protein n=1 Tax=Rubellicoccus peritrichatus TaxID=3080537 RepID=A0AAQ3LBA9_9BACT|nr:adenylate/guanylate cyclase domain-containing protein [Puniceicoccus sp. CR14]WOO42695.1 adenylate/guanylate cyclase domain-containing protein [Puniceicoccus sp. CR14]
MAEKPIERHYYVRSLDFRDFWDICGHFQRSHPSLPDIRYSIDGPDGRIIDREIDVASILRKLGSDQKDVSFQAELTDDADGGWKKAVLSYRSKAEDASKEGLSFLSPGVDKLALAEFEEVIFDQYDLPEEDTDQVQFGHPCEMLAAVLDMRGFSSFCEKPNIESPYICGLMYSFYKMAVRGFKHFPADMVKFTGDGLVAVWETTVETRQMAIEACLQGAMEIDAKWQVGRRRPQFSHGAPDSIGVGISFGLGSRVPDVSDYIGRPINVASRLCNACPGGDLIVDKSVPGIGDDIRKEDTSVHVKSFGRYYVWRIRGI